MKKIWVFCLCALLVSLTQQTVSAAEYLTYQKIDTNAGVMLLRDYGTADYDAFYNRINRRRFWGWQTYTVFKNEPVTFQKETLFVITNDGETPITQSFTFRTTQQDKLQVSATGNIGITTGGNIQGFALGLDARIQQSISHERQRMIEEHIEIDISVDPGTRLEVEVFGEGLLSNGVAKYYIFWMNRRAGGWEVFVLTTEYLSIVKTPLKRR